MKRRDFLKGVATVPIVGGILKTKTDISILDVPSLRTSSPEPSEVSKPEKEEQLPEKSSGIYSTTPTPSATYSCSPSASC